MSETKFKLLEEGCDETIRGFNERIDELKSLKNGWYDGEGLAPKAEDLDWVKDIFEKYYPPDFPLPAVFPTVEGGIQMEWEKKDTREHVEIEFDLENHGGEFFYLNLKTDESFGSTINFDCKECINTFVNKMRMFFNANKD